MLQVLPLLANLFHLHWQISSGSSSFVQLNFMFQSKLVSDKQGGFTFLSDKDEIFLLRN